MKKYGIVYLVKNNINNKYYVGITKNNFNNRYACSGNGAERLFWYHMSVRNKNQYYNKDLLLDLIKYGTDNFTVNEELDIAYNEKELYDLEIKYISLYDSFNNGYNQTLGGKGTVGVSIHNKGLSKPCYMIINGEYKEFQSVSEMSRQLDFRLAKVNSWFRGMNLSFKKCNISEIGYIIDNHRKKVTPNLEGRKKQSEYGKKRSKENPDLIEKRRDRDKNMRLNNSRIASTLDLSKWIGKELLDIDRQEIIKLIVDNGIMHPNSKPFTWGRICTVLLSTNKYHIDGIRKYDKKSFITRL